MFFSINISWQRQRQGQGQRQGITEYYRILQSITKYYRVLQSITECDRVLQSITEFYSVAECYRVLQSITKTNVAHLLGPIFGFVILGFSPWEVWLAKARMIRRGRRLTWVNFIFIIQCLWKHKRYHMPQPRLLTFKSGSQNVTKQLLFINLPAPAATTISMRVG